MVYIFCIEKLNLYINKGKKEDLEIEVVRIFILQRFLTKKFGSYFFAATKG